MPRSRIDNNSLLTLESSCLLLGKELFLRFPYHPLQTPPGNVGVQSLADLRQFKLA
jgi:hypothetical protein